MKCWPALLCLGLLSACTSQGVAHGIYDSRALAYCRDPAHDLDCKSGPLPYEDYARDQAALGR